MAIDTAAKRRSAAGVSFFLMGPGVTPDATPDGSWRQSSGWSYGGILAEAPIEVSTTGSRYRYGYRYTWSAGFTLFIMWWL